MHVKLANGSVEQFPYTLGQLRRDNPNVSFPKQVIDNILADYDVYPVTALEKPDYDPLVQSLSRGQPSWDNGSWKVSYTVQNMLQSEAEANVRSERDSLLQETDWLAVSDRTMTAEQTAYRQALRDITGQAGFPFSVTWPVKV
jgi:hypothetical protein